jgi:hypothetical protein
MLRLETTVKYISKRDLVCRFNYTQRCNALEMTLQKECFDLSPIRTWLLPPNSIGRSQNVQSF